ASVISPLQAIPAWRVALAGTRERWGRLTQRAATCNVGVNWAWTARRRGRSSPICRTNRTVRARVTYSSSRSTVRPMRTTRSEEHTSELQSLTNLVCRLLLEKKKHTDTPTLD